jgi:predicted ATPase/class 3 adenylate cyclase
MRELPSGTVTFLFTDIEGSTRLLDELGSEGYAEALAEHRRHLREAFAHHSGVEVDTQGDAFFVAFPTAPGALAAAAEAQASLAAGPIQVRMALHTGTPLVTEDGYIGIDVHRAARIAAAGHGAQVLVSATTAALIETNVLRDLGEHRFKDLAAAERVYQLGEAEFPPLRSLYRTNLPVPATPFLGRERELAEVTNLLLREDIRVLTLTGSGGTGKTRLALQAAAASAEVYPDGLTWVPLSPLRDPSLALPAVAQALELNEEPGRALADTLAAKLAGAHALFVLDNAEHLLPGVAGELARLRDTDGPTLLVTSRERLRLDGEHVWPVPPLDEDDGVALFVVRARSLDYSFTPTEEVDQLCARLDNLPLALELAAARTSLFSPAQLLGRLAQRLDLLKGGREAEPRHQTLRATIAWSYELLDEDEQQLFRGLSVFPAGCSYEAAEAVCEAEPDMLQSLIDKSLVRRRDTEDGPRYWMLETIREYAAEQLQGAADAAEIRRRHADAYLALAEAAYPHLRGGDQGLWLDRLTVDHDNLRAALASSVEQGRSDVTVRLGLALINFWDMRGHSADLQKWLPFALAASETAPPLLRSRALRLASSAARKVGKRDEADAYVQEALRLSREAGEEDELAFVLTLMGIWRSQEKKLDEAERLWLEAAVLFRKAGNEWGLAGVLGNLGNVATDRGKTAQARALYAEALDIHMRLESWQNVAMDHMNLALLSFEEGAFEQTRSEAHEALAASTEIDFRDGLAGGLHLLGRVALAEGDAKRAVRFLSAAERILDDVGGTLPPEDAANHAESVAAARAELGEERFEAARRAGYAMKPEDLVDVPRLGAASRRTVGS